MGDIGIITGIDPLARATGRIPPRGMALDFGRCTRGTCAREAFVSHSDPSESRFRRVAALRSHKTAADPALRQSGIRVMGDVTWGAHFCLFYETKEDLIDTACTYFKAGLKGDEFCVWAVSDPITEAEAEARLRLAIPEFDRHLAAGRIEIIDGTEWYLGGGQFDMEKITGGWNTKLRGALSKGYAGMRLSGNAFWLETQYWQAFCDYEHELNRSLTDQKMIVLCTYPLPKSKAADVLDVARAHQCTSARRHGDWEYLETPELRQAKQEIEKLQDALDILSKPFPGHEALTQRERVALAHIVRGASNKEAARTLSVSPRTIEFHRANIMRKIGAKNTADLVLKVLCR
jgi:DNA-binding CsgD family transcriptional regulator